MAERIWDKFLTERDRQVFAAAGFGATSGLGKKPALLVIDVNYAFCGDKREPILDSIKRWKHSCGEDAWDAIPVLKNLIDACRAKGIPVIYTTGGNREDGWDAGSWAWKNSRTHEDVRTVTTQIPNRPGTDIVDEIAPGPKDIVIRKLKPSAFAGTPLMSFLNDLGVDSLIVTGTTTSGCVRASVLDAFTLNLRQVVVEEGCFDRSQASHAINLCDMHAKYADVLPAADALSLIKNVGDDVTYNLPSGKPRP
jgi:maleamate amidohydrolase